MNIFYLDSDPRVAAQYHCDKHVCKMVVETFQLLSTAHHVLAPEKSSNLPIYKKTHENHPSNVWLRSHIHHYHWSVYLATSLLFEYTIRYGKTHACARLLEYLAEPPSSISTDFDLRRPPPQCMPDEYKVPHDTVLAYRNYYQGSKAHFARYTNRPSPPWLVLPEKAA